MAKEKELKAKISLKDNFSKNADKVARKTQKIIEKEKKLQKRHRKLGLILGKPIKVIFKFDKKIFNQLDKVKSKFNSIKSSLKGFRKNIVIKVKSSTAFVALKKIKSNLIALKKLRAVKLLVNLKDKASGRMKKILSNVKTISGKVFRFTVRAKDATKKVLGGIKRALGALAKGLVIPITASVATLKGAMDLETQKVSMRHFMGVGNKGKSSKELDKMSNKYFNDLRKNANATPFETGEVMAIGARGLQIAEGNTKQAMKYVKLAEDMAA